MKRLWILSALLVPLATMGGDELHTFTNAKGQKLEAALVGFEDGRVTIRRSSDGREFVLPLQGLSVADQEYVMSKMGGQGAKAGEERDAEIAPGVKMTFCWCPRGKFLMGEGAKAHPVSLSKGFWMGKYEVTQEQWQKVMGNNPSKFKEAGPDAPVESLSWGGAQEFVFKLGGSFHLPTEAQWEYACRAGSVTAYSFGDDESKLGEHAWFNQASAAKPELAGQKKAKTGTHPVGLKKPNDWGICDMLGNVAEWCQDYFQQDLGASPVTDPAGPPTGVTNVVRGGRWDAAAADCRSVARYGISSKSINSNLGFRIIADSIRVSPAGK